MSIKKALFGGGVETRANNLQKEHLLRERNSRRDISLRLFHRDYECFLTKQEDSDLEHYSLSGGMSSMVRT